MKKKTKIKFWATLGRWQYDLVYRAGKARRLFRKFCKRYSERVGMALVILLFLIISWGMFLYLFNMLLGDHIDLVGELL